MPIKSDENGPNIKKSGVSISLKLLNGAIVFDVYHIWYVSHWYYLSEIYYYRRKSMKYYIKQILIY